MFVSYRRPRDDFSRDKMLDVLTYLILINLFVKSCSFLFFLSSIC